MQLTVAPETVELLEQKQRESGLSSTDDLLVAAMQALESQRLDGLDEDTLGAIDEAEDAIERREVYPMEEVEDKIRAMFAKRK